jgi:hypothetical protein
MGLAENDLKEAKMDDEQNKALRAQVEASALASREKEVREITEAQKVAASSIYGKIAVPRAESKDEKIAKLESALEIAKASNDALSQALRLMHRRCQKNEGAAGKLETAKKREEHARQWARHCAAGNEKAVDEREEALDRVCHLEHELLHARSALAFHKKPTIWSVIKGWFS